MTNELDEKFLRHKEEVVKHVGKSSSTVLRTYDRCKKIYTFFVSFLSTIKIWQFAKSFQKKALGHI